MNKQLWKEVFDNLDEDIVNSAAERLGKAKYSNENPADYPADSSPVEYRITKKRSSKSIWLAVGIGSAAAVALGVGIVSFIGTGNPGELVQPLSGEGRPAQSTVDNSSIADKPVDYVESKIESIPEGSVELQTGGFDLELFEEYFYGAWRDDGGWTMQLGYSPNEFFGYSSGRTVAGMSKDSDGCYMLQKTNEGYDMLFVPQDNKDTLYYYYNVTLEDGEVVSNNDFTGIYTRSGTVTEGNVLGYFGVEKLAYEMGVSSDFLLWQDIQFEGGDAELWIRNTSFGDCEKIYLLEQTENSVTLRMKYHNNTNSETAFFDVTFERNGEEWERNSIKSVTALKFRASDDVFLGITREGLTLFKQHFHGFWNGETDEYPSLTLLYVQDIFTPAEYCRGIEADIEGWAMYQYTDEGMKVYYIPENDQQTMYLYTPDENGFVEPNDCKARYERAEIGKGYAESSRLSWMGLMRYKLHHFDTTWDGSLADAITKALNDVYDETWYAANYTADMEGWDGYRISELSENEVLFYFQQFTRDGESRWVCQQLVKVGSDWTTGDLRVDITEDELEIEGSYEDKIPVDWSEDWDIEEIESVGAVDGR